MPSHAQTPASAPAAAPAAPAAPPAQATPTAVGPGTGNTPLMPGVPTTEAGVRALRAARETLSEQMISAQSRRDELVKELREANSGVDRTGLEQRLAITDARLMQLESDLASTGRLLAASPAGQATTTSRGGRDFPPLQNMDTTAVSVVFSLFVLAPMAVAVARLIWRRGSMPAASRTPSDTTQRLERMEQAIDTIAVEVERISEGQRFVTRLLGEANGGLPALGRVAQHETLPLGRGQ
jgi:hypothetical protein